MQTLFLVALGLLSGSAVIAGAVHLALYPPSLFKKPIMADPLDRSDTSEGTTVYVGSDSSGGGDGHC
ncbi:hypothetical protein N7E02_21625 [Aliirhizobium terrae]|uniref:hypothetical protein n=1 Tax=Terrirhizobium terrae TaxID=2926709 RepID=UPI002574EE7E|nr:hypothetical protein [Rhizobium sp. CC-CFT758]WJH39411.1 hypothetical protein N7E02_21625 [Rhizobium sp. CC-CFT758]